MNTKKQDRRQLALERLNNQMPSGVKNVDGVPIPLTDEDKERIINEIRTLNDRLNGIKKKKKVTDVTEEGVPKSNANWVIDIHAIHLGYVKKSERRKNKGKSRKKMRKTRSVSFVKSVPDKPGLIAAYREGKMGISPRSHSFRLRRIEEVAY